MLLPNRRPRPVLRAVAYTLLALLVLSGAFLAWVVGQIPGRGEDRLQLSAAETDVVGVWARQSYAWIIRTPHGAILVDTGGEADAATVKAELEKLGRTPEQVQAILLTHGHKDHWSAAALFPNAEVLVGPGERDVLTEKFKLESPAGRLTRVLFPKPPMPQRIREVRDGEALTIDTLTFTAVHVPGHTPGSTMYLLGDLLFSGDTLLGDGERVVPPPSFLSESDAELRKSLEKLASLDFTRLADGHTGLAIDAKTKLETLLASPQTR